MQRTFYPGSAKTAGEASQQPQSRSEYNIQPCAYISGPETRESIATTSLNDGPWPISPPFHSGICSLHLSA